MGEGAGAHLDPTGFLFLFFLSVSVVGFVLTLC